MCETGCVCFMYAFNVLYITLTACYPGKSSSVVSNDAEIHISGASVFISVTSFSSDLLSAVHR